MPITQKLFGSTYEGTPVHQYALSNANGLSAEIITYGGALTAFSSPDRDGVIGNTVLGFDTLAPYLGVQPYLGALIGRYGNRIAKGRFSLAGKEYQLAINNGLNHLHGGPGGFHSKVWGAEVVTNDAGLPQLELRYISRDGEEGYPGTLNITVTYSLNDANELSISYSATSDATTIFNPTNHAYFNLAGSGTVLNHELELFAAQFLPVDANLIPLGELRSVADTPMDFRHPKTIGLHIHADDEQLGYGKGFDHNWVLNKAPGELALAARAYDPQSGRVLEMETTEPGVQFYSGNHLDGDLFIGYHGERYGPHTGFCLEAQHYPDSPNQLSFPSTMLEPGQTYHQQTIYRLLVK